MLKNGIGLKLIIKIGNGGGGVKIHGGKTLLTFLDKDKEYKLYDESNHVVEKKKGDILQSSHYDSVEIGVRERQEKLRKDRERKEKMRAAALKKRSAKPKTGKGTKR